MRTTRLTKIAMVIFLSMIFFLGVQRPVLAADRNTTVKIPVEQINQKLPLLICGRLIIKPIQWD